MDLPRGGGVAPPAARRGGRAGLSGAVPIGEDDLPALLALNQANVPHVGALDEAGLRRLVGWSWWAVTTPERDALMIVLPPGVPYGSPNYRWVSARWSRFAYVDRIAVAEGRRGAGVGRRLYEELAARAAAAGVPRIVCEVNTRPPNPGSLAFHERLGFRRTGVRAGAGHAVAMMLRPV